MSHHCLPVSSNPSCHCPQTSLNPSFSKAFRTAAHWISSFVFHTILYNLLTVWKSQVMYSFLNTQTSPTGTTNHAMVKGTKITFFPILLWSHSFVFPLCIRLLHCVNEAVLIIGVLCKQISN